MRKFVAPLAAAALMACGSAVEQAPAPEAAVPNPCAGTICANPHPAGWSGIDLSGGTSLHGNAVLAGDETCGGCHTQTGGGSSGRLDGVKEADAHDGLVCTHCHLSLGPGQTVVAGRIHLDSWPTENRADRIRADTLAPLKGGPSAGCLSCHLNG